MTEPFTVGDIASNREEEEEEEKEDGVPQGRITKL